jgi:hypothetical protein
VRSEKLYEKNHLMPSGATSNNKARRAVWLKTLHQWHWISSSVCLLGMLLFSITGITLNHSAQIEAKPSVTRAKAVLPSALQAELRQFATGHDGAKALLPAATQRWLQEKWSLQAEGRIAEWSLDEVYLPLPKAGGDAWVRIALDAGAVDYERTDRGWISWLNDVHKGRNTGSAWSWFIDIFAAGCLAFCLTGLLILKFHAVNRPLTWPMVGLGILIPCALALLFIH